MRNDSRLLVLFIATFVATAALWCLAQDCAPLLVQKSNKGPSGQWQLFIGPSAENGKDSDFVPNAVPMYVTLNTTGSQVKGTCAWSQESDNFCASGNYDSINLKGTVTGDQIEIDIVLPRQVYSQYSTVREKVKKACHDFNPLECFSYVPRKHLERKSFDYEQALKYYLALVDELKERQNNKISAYVTRMKGVVKSDSEIQGIFVSNDNVRQSDTVYAAFEAGRSFTLRKIAFRKEPLRSKIPTRDDGTDEDIESGTIYLGLASVCLNNAGNCAASLGRLSEAISLYKQALEKVKPYRHAAGYSMRFNENLKIISDMKNGIEPIEKRSADQIDELSSIKAQRITWLNESCGGQSAMVIPAK